MTYVYTNTEQVHKMLICDHMCADNSSHEPLWLWCVFLDKFTHTITIRQKVHALQPVATVLQTLVPVIVISI